MMFCRSKTLRSVENPEISIQGYPNGPRGPSSLEKIKSDLETIGDGKEVEASSTKETSIPSAEGNGEFIAISTGRERHGPSEKKKSVTCKGGVRDGNAQIRVLEFIRKYYDHERNAPGPFA